jgi:hypothetical protein
MELCILVKSRGSTDHLIPQVDAVTARKEIVVILKRIVEDAHPATLCHWIEVREWLRQFKQFQVFQRSRKSLGPCRFPPTNSVTSISQ